MPTPDQQRPLSDAIRKAFSEIPQNPYDVNSLFEKRPQPEDEPTQHLPRYKCHKTVEAFKILEISAAHEDLGAELIPAEVGILPVKVSKEYLQKHNPKKGGYFVVYADGYRSYSPADAFEDGYTRVE